MKKKIMIIDDDPDLIESLKTVIEKISDRYEVISGRNGEECFEILKNGIKPDLIVLDIMMPEMNGWEVFAKIKEEKNWRDIPVVFLTAKTDSFSKGMGGFSADDYITKPFDVEDLKEKIFSMLEEEK